MVQRLKRWESPRKQGRNDKGKGGSARARQLRKREQMLKAKLKKQGDRAKKGGKALPLFLGFFEQFIERRVGDAKNAKRS